MVSALTITSRVMGFIRTLAATSILGITFLGNAYASANALPNLLFEIIAGGALAAALLPALSGPAALGDKQTVEQTASAVLNRALLVMVPVVVAGIAFRGPIVGAITASVADPRIRALEAELASFLLVFFLPQLWLYVVGVVLTAVLHAHHRFSAPAVAPLISSVVVTASYLLYALIEGPGADRLESISGAGRLVLGLGTTLGVAMLSLSLVPPVLRLGIKWRPFLGMPDEVSKRIKALAVPAMVTVGAQQVFLAVVLVLANGVEGGVVAYQLCFTLLLVFWAIFPLPMATTHFPGLAQAATRDIDEFANRSSAAGRKIIFIVFGASALMFSVAGPAAELVIDLGAGGGADSRQMVGFTVAAFSPGLVGYGLYAFFTRTMYALGNGRSAAVAAVAGFGAGIAVNVAAAEMLEGATLIAALAGGFSAGISLAAGLLVSMFRREAGGAALAGAGAGSLRGLASGVGAAAAGALIASAMPPGSLTVNVFRTLVSSIGCLAVYFGLQRLLGDKEMDQALRQIRAGARRTGPGAGH